MRVCFYKEKKEDVEISINAILEDEKLTLEGCDNGELVEKWWGDDDYEYWLKFDKENTEKLFKKLGVANKTDKEKLETIRNTFSKDKDISGVQKYCEENDIKTSFNSWA